MWPLQKNAPPPCGHVFQPTGIIFKLVQGIIGINLLTKFHEDWAIHVVSRVLTRFYYSHIRKNAPPLGSHVFQANVTIFELIQYIIKTNLLTKFHEDWTINVASRERTRQMLTSHFRTDPRYHWEKFSDQENASRVLTKKNAPTPRCQSYCQPTGIIFEFVQDIIGMNFLTEFHEDRTINVASRPYNEKCPAPWQPCFSSEHWTIHVASIVLTRKNAPPPGGHVFQPKDIISELFHEDWTINVDVFNTDAIKSFHIGATMSFSGFTD
ncbi:hypothetical protein DPMN_060370 [Dreissena polymorpha]|uniref:Uncharacterized protein n=1 Tax=Dreissena polymorpha TaxID=45954 RepID=A0A9D4C5L0_DREPO|nr:hypothetical protein DPMN_060370 [Dreissena polymorpha]